MSKPAPAASWVSPVFFFCCFCCFCHMLFSSPPFLLSHSAMATVVRSDLPVLSFDEGYTQLFGDRNLMLLKDGKTVRISLDHRTGSGFASQDLYLYGFFSASIKLPSGYTAGVIVAFYMSNGDVFEKTHDELDFEFLGNIRGEEWRVQTNVYGNGSTANGREERYGLWFDPTEDFHQYGILWSPNKIIFFVDNIPIRETTRSQAAMGGEAFPSKAMSLYATIWDGSSWATNGGRYKVDYKRGPYVAEFAELSLHGCAVDPSSDHSSSTCDESGDDRLYKSFTMTSEQRAAMEVFREKHMSYSYCYDRERYPTTPLPECTIDPLLAVRFVHGSSSASRFKTQRNRGKHQHRRSKSQIR